jgi:hypothetical protein
MYVLLLSLLLQQPQQPKPATIRGRVTTADTGAAIAQATVSVFSSGSSIYASTNQTGTYEISVPAGRCSVSAQKTGYLRTNYIRDPTI